MVHHCQPGLSDTPGDSTLKKSLAQLLVSIMTEQRTVGVFVCAVSVLTVDLVVEYSRERKSNTRSE
jgi:hypothetical protein